MSDPETNSVILARIGPDKVVLEFCVGANCQLYKMDVPSVHALIMALSEISQPRPIVQSMTIHWKDPANGL